MNSRKRKVASIGDSPGAFEWDPDTIQIKGFSKGITEIQWLLVALVLLYLVVTDGGAVNAQFQALIGIGVYVGFTLIVNYLSFFQISQRWVMALQCWAMIVFITSSLHYMGTVEGPMVNLYILPVIVSALALGKVTTILQVGAVAACYLLLLSLDRAPDGMSLADLGLLAAYGVMFLLVGYLTIMLADAIHFANSRMRVLARTDQLTGLLNMATFRVLAHKFYARALRSSQPFGIIMADMDNLKEINDGHGHSAGDQAIIDMAKNMEAVMRKSDVLARYGGDEFAILLPDTDLRGTLRLAERLQSEATPVSGHSIKPLFSVGIAVYPNHGSSIEELLEKADKALYQSKAGGGDAITIYNYEIRQAV